MPRMFDILRGKNDDSDTNNQTHKDTNKKDNPADKEKALKDSTLSFPKGILTPDSKFYKEPQDSLVSQKLISAVKKHGVDNQEKTKEIYENALETVKILLVKVRLKEDITTLMDNIYSMLDDIFNQLVLGENILDNIYDRDEDEYYFPCHIVNVTILSCLLGLNMGFNKSRLNHLGVASIFYDLGLDALRDTTSLPRKLRPNEFSLIKEHILNSLKIVEKISNINEIVKETIQMHHERANGAGYPSGITVDAINPYAKIIGLVDTYEAITNNRPYRDGLKAHQAMKFLIGSLKDEFDADVMKIFINKMSLYPIGSIVRLDTQELARVISVQPHSPLRPVVMIIQNESGEAVLERQIIDLSKQDFPSIQDSV